MSVDQDPQNAESPADPAELGGAVRTVSGLTLTSRIFGLGRDLLMVRIFGDTVVWSAFATAFAIPNMFRRLFGEGALAAAFIPEYAQIHKRDQALASRFASLTLVLLVLVTGSCTILGEIGLAAAVNMAADDPDKALSFRLIMVMLPFMPLVCAAAILGGMLQTHGRFAPHAAAPIILNIFMIAAGAYHFLTAQDDPRRTAFILGIATVGAGIVQILWFLVALRKHVRWSTTFAGAGGHARTMLRRFGPVVIGLGTLQINALLDIFIAQWPNWVGPTIFGYDYPLDAKSTGILFSSQRLYQFPLGVFGIAVATAVFPMLARAADEPGRFADTLRRGLRLSLFIGLPASIGLILVREDLTLVLFGGGERGFSESGVIRSSAVLLGYAVAIWAYSINHVFTRAFYAAGNTKTPMKIAIAMVAVNVVLNFTLIWPLREAGLAWSTAISAILQCMILATLCSTKLGVQPLDAHTRKALTRIIIATVLMAVGVGAFEFLWPQSQTWPGHLLAMALAAGIGVGLYTAFAVGLKLPELRWLLARTVRNND